ncbi:unnamed protein product [Rotaria magnacalcarata]|uniref:Amidase domain-containing protein n=4 Tax=Rotaria magnacalcarata TaxID=392030 RepID=A0A816QK70_9BILA|nr:unnamed protein product [Rotaria magnacalcarata]
MSKNNEKEKESSTVENETGGLETACYRQCHGQFCLTPTVNHFVHEIPLDFSPFLDSLANYTPTTYERIETLLKSDHSIDRVKSLILNKHIICKDLCLYYLKRIQMTNNYYKAIIELNPHSLSEAQQIDEQINENNVNDKLLFGCVAAVKGNISVCDMYNDAGSYVLHENKMKDDASIIKKLRKQGCVIIGRTNLSEWAYALSENIPSGFSAVGGQCLHPDDIREDISGSSSGSAAGIKLNLFTFSLGTETQGSILSPAIHTKHVCALKPSVNAWPKDNIIPINYDQDTCGPLARTIEDIELLHRIATDIKDDHHSRPIRVGYIIQSQEDLVILQSLSPLLPLTTLVDLNKDPVLAQLIIPILDPSRTCNVTFQDYLCYALGRDILLYLSAHSSSYSHETISSIVEWNSSHSQYIPYGQLLFTQALQSKLTQEAYDKYRQTVKEGFQSFVEYLKSRYSIDCLLTVDNRDIFASTAVCGTPRATLTLDYYNPDHQQINVVAVGFSLGDDLLLFRLLQRLEKARL